MAQSCISCEALIELNIKRLIFFQCTCTIHSWKRILVCICNMDMTIGTMKYHEVFSLQESVQYFKIFSLWRTAFVKSRSFTFIAFFFLYCLLYWKIYSMRFYSPLCFGNEYFIAYVFLSPALLISVLGWTLPPPPQQCTSVPWPAFFIYFMNPCIRLFFLWRERGKERTDTDGSRLI